MAEYVVLPNVSKMSRAGPCKIADYIPFHRYPSDPKYVPMGTTAMRIAKRTNL